MISSASVDPAVAVLFLESAVHGLDFAEHVVFVDILHPVVSAVLLIVIILIHTSSGMVGDRLEAIMALHLSEVSDGLREESKGVNEDHGNLRQETCLVNGIQNDCISSNESSREHGSFSGGHSVFERLKKVGFEVSDATRLSAQAICQKVRVLGSVSHLSLFIETLIVSAAVVSAEGNVLKISRARSIGVFMNSCLMPCGCHIWHRYGNNAT